MNQQRQGLTLIEVLVVIGIVALLIVLMLPAIQAARETARRSKCQNNLRQVSIALHSHHSSHQQFPAGWIADEPYGYPGWGWATALLPYLEEKPVEIPEPVEVDTVEDQKGPPPWAGGLGNRTSLPPGLLKTSISAPAVQTFRETPVPVFLCPSDSSPKVFMLMAADATDAVNASETDEESAGDLTSDEPLFMIARANYTGVFGTQSIQASPEMGNGTFYHNSQTRLEDISRDGTSNTIIVGERSSRLGAVTWVGSVGEAHRPVARVVGRAERVPNDPLGHFDDFGSHHVAGAHFLFGDGGVRMLSQAIDRQTYQALATRDGGEVVNPEGFVQRPAPFGGAVFAQF